MYVWFITHTHTHCGKAETSVPMQFDLPFYNWDDSIRIPSITIEIIWLKSGDGELDF